MCNKDVGFNSTKCLVCGFRGHKPYSNFLKGLLKPNTDFKCKKCREEVTYATIPDTDPVNINGEEIEKVRSFCYLSDFIGERHECFDTTTATIISKWKKFRELLPILACRSFSLRTHGYDYYACVRSVLLYASETRTATQEDVSRLNHNYMMMIRCIYSTKLADKIPSEELRS